MRGGQNEAGGGREFLTAAVADEAREVDAGAWRGTISRSRKEDQDR